MMIKKILPLAIFFSSLVPAQTDTALIFSEVMFFPTSGPNEFVELYNNSSTDSIDLSNYKIIYSTSSPDIIMDFGDGTILPPESFAIILEGDYPFGTGIYDGIIPPEALVLKISDNSFGSSGMANNTDRPLWLISSLNDTIETYLYSADNSQSFSDEKIELIDDNSSKNWGNSISSNGTPGFRNSLTPLDFDLEMSLLTFSPVLPKEGDDVTIFAKVKNRGINAVVNYTIEIYNDANFDSVADQGERIYSESFLNLQSGDSIVVNSRMNSLSAGNYQVISQVLFPEDENLNNNVLLKGFTIFPPGNNYNDLVLNELMYAPTSGEPEWLELFNRSSESINLKNWNIADLTTTVSITNQDIFIPSNSFVVLTKDSSIVNFYNVTSEIIELNLPSLNNNGDAIVIKDSLNVLIDSVLYSPDWGGNTGGRSLERIFADDESNSPANWGTSLDISKATPGSINSITPKDFDLAISLFDAKSEFGIIGEEIQFQIQVSNQGLNKSQNYYVKLYRDANSDSIAQSSELISTQSGVLLPSGDSLIFNFVTKEFLVGINYFITKVETSVDDDTTNNFRYRSMVGATVNEVRNDIIINEFMYAPGSSRPEWIEIFNRSNKTIDLKNYQVSDNNDTTRVVSVSIILNPLEYLIIAEDSSVHNFYNIPSAVIIGNIPALNNSGDKLILLDSLNRTIDSLEYSPDWGGNDGKSLERIDSEISSTDSANWSTSKSIFGATPGYINSITQKDFDLAALDILFSPKFPLDNDTVSIAVKVLNRGLQPARFVIELFEDNNLDSIPDMLIETTSILNLSPGDSSTFQFSYQIINIVNRHGFTVRAVFEMDEDTTNNSNYKTISTGFPPQSLVVNELMFTPQGGEPEWIELYNNTGSLINLRDWRISDILTTPVNVFIEEDVLISSASYLILTKDNSIINYHRLIPSKIYELNLPVLNNDIDGIILKDDRGAVIDSVRYMSDWGGTTGYSLERKETDAASNLPLNWGSSIDIEQSTPGRINSITPKQFDLSVASLSFNPRFPVSGDDVYISTLIKNNGSSDANNFNIEFYIDTDSNGVVDQLLSSEIGLSIASGDSAVITSNLAIENLTSKVLTAVRIAFQEDEDTLNNYVEKAVQPGFPEKILVVNEVMYSPANGEPEWIELVNISADSINLINWSISDILSTPTKNFITNENAYIQPDEFLIIAKDTSFNSFHPTVEAKIMVVNFGTLGNTSDGIIIYDFRNGIIDSLFYSSSWGGGNGFSLERISVDEETNNNANWTTSLDPNGSTPGMPNSIENVQLYKRNDLVINEIMFEPDADNSEYIEFFNSGNSSVNIGGWRIEDENSNSEKLSEVSLEILPNNYFVLASDSSILIKFGLTEEDNFTILDISSLGLVNSGELILLSDVRGNIIDSVWYSDKWHNDNFVSTQNISLERINPRLNGNDASNWSSSVNPLGGTPAKVNSIFTDNLNTESNISVSPNPFSPDDDGFEDFTIINYNLTQATSQVRIKIFDSQGRLVRTLLSSQASGSSGSVVFDGLADDGEALRIGIYIIFLEAINEGVGVVENLKTVVVVARKL